MKQKASKNYELNEQVQCMQYTRVAQHTIFELRSIDQRQRDSGNYNGEVKHVPNDLRFLHEAYTAPMIEKEESKHQEGREGR